MANTKESTDEDVVILTREGDAGAPGFIFRHLLHKDARFSKLVTREDPYHLHKTLGLLSLLSFIYRYGYCYNTFGNLGFDGAAGSVHNRAFDWATMLVHLCLAFSSIIFRVPSKRIHDKPMVIYEEYRQHAMVFTLRCFLVFAIHDGLALSVPAPAWAASIAVLACHLLADRITAIHGTSGNTAVRATQAHMKLSATYRAVGKLYSIYQFLAIASHILPNARAADLAYNAIIAIQSSAFMMTLYRKRIIRGTTHMVVYGLCLAVSQFHILRLLSYKASGLVVVAFLLRIFSPRKYSNKYAVWCFFLVAENWNDLASLAAAPVITTSYDALVELPAARGVAFAGAVYAMFVGERVVADSSKPPAGDDKAAATKQTGLKEQ